jgi:hypothetical protein
LEECITSIFRTEEKASKKPVIVKQLKMEVIVIT